MEHIARSKALACTVVVRIRTGTVRVLLRSIAKAILLKSEVDDIGIIHDPSPGSMLGLGWLISFLFLGRHGKSPPYHSGMWFARLNGIAQLEGSHFLWWRAALLCLCLISYINGSRAADNIDYKIDIYRNPTSDHPPELDRFISFTSFSCPVQRKNQKYRQPTCSETLQGKLAEISETYELQSYLRNNRFDCKMDTNRSRVMCRRDFVVIDRPSFLFQTPIEEVHFIYHIKVRFPRNSELPVPRSQIEVSFDNIQRNFPLD